MNEPNQLDLSGHQSKNKRKVIYIPPPPEIVDRYAFDVCQAYKANQQSKAVDTEFIQGFKAFVRAVVKTHANFMNRGR